MKRTVRFALAGLLACVVGVGITWPWLGDAGRTGLLAAAGLAWLVQVVSFGALVRFRTSTKGFLAAWVGGTLVRMGLILVAAWAVVRLPALPPAPTLLGLAGFFFGMLLLEPLFFGSDGTPASVAGTGALDTATMDIA